MLFLPLSGLAMAIALLPVGADVHDLRVYLVPWMDHVRAGGLASLSGEFSNYSPPYIYLLYLFSGLVPYVGSVAAIKLIGVPFVVANAIGLAATVFTATGDRARASVAAAVFCVTPTILVNAFLWGQADIIYTCFLMLFVLAAIGHRPVFAALMFGIALSFKLQAMFLAPLILYLVISAQMPIMPLFLIPLAYVGMMIPAAFAGRPWLDLLGVYYGQSQYLQILVFGAPNPWRIIDKYHFFTYQQGTLLGLVAGTAVALALAFGGLKLARNSSTTLLLATLCAALMPYVLPKMHERYFFVADVLTIALAFVIPRSWPAAVLFQIGSLTAYLGYFDVSPRAPSFAFFPVTFGIIVLLTMLRDRSVRPVAPEGSAVDAA